MLVFSYPDRLMNGDPLRDIASLEIYRAADPSPALTAARPTARGGAVPGDEAPGSAARREAANVRVAEQAFYREAERVDVLEVPAIAERTRGATVVYRDPLGPLLSAAKPPRSLAYAVVSVRRGGERSPLSNIVTLSPDVPPGPPAITSVTPEEGRICLEWTPPATDLLGRPAAVGGYRLYRRTLPEEEYGAPLNADPIIGTVYVDTTAPYGGRTSTPCARPSPASRRSRACPRRRWASTTATSSRRPRRRAWTRCRKETSCASSGSRSPWRTSPATSSSGRKGDGAPARLTPQPVTDTFFSDTTVTPGRRYRYTVVAVDTAGNASAQSPEAVAETF